MGLNLEQVCAAVDTLNAEHRQAGFTQKEIIALLGIKASSFAGAMVRLERKGLIVRVNDGAKKNVKYTATKSLQLAWANKELADIWSIKYKYDPSNPEELNHRSYGKREKIEEEEEIELDPMEVLEQLTSDDFSQLVSTYVSRKNAEIGPLKEEIRILEDRVRFMDNEAAQLERRNETDLNMLRNQLKQEREVVINLRLELERVKGQLVHKEAPIRTILVQKGGAENLHKENGGGGPHKRATIVVHKKPLTGNAPKSVLKR